jgi:hypothetical protein
MAAGLGFKDFTTGEVLTANDVDGYLMQGIWVFASAAARDAAVTSPQEGNFAYLKDTNVTTYYTGSAWTNLDTTGMVNPMTTTGDTIYSSSGTTPARLGIGSTGQVLTVAGGVPTWAAAAGSGALTLIQRSSFSNVANTGTTFDNVFTATYKSYIMVIETIYAATAGDDLHFQFRSGAATTSTSYYGNYYGYALTTSLVSTFSNNANQLTIANDTGSSASVGGGIFTLYGVGNTTQARITGQYYNLNAGESGNIGGSRAGTNFDGFLLKSASTNITGTVAIYGMAAA